MPRKAKTNKKLIKIDPQIMKTAVQKVLDGWSIRAAAKNHNICHQTLKRYVAKLRNAQENAEIKYEPNYTIRKVFSDELEALLKEYIIKACKLHHGLTRTDVQKLAYQLAISNNLTFPAQWEKNKMAGEDWLNGFRRRHPSISIRKPEGTSLSRATAFNETNVKEFFDNLAQAYQRIKDISANDIYNLDETALTTVHNPPKVLGPKGQKQVGQITSGERGVLVTACCIINAAGQAVPPYLIFPRVNFKPHMLNGAPNGAGGNANKSGWVNSVIFIDILKHFVKFVKCTEDKPVLLIMDNHESHISIGSLEYAKRNGIILLTLPPHTSGKLQPLDKTVYKSLKTNYNIVCNEWMISNPSRTITIYDIAGLFGIAYLKAFSPENIINGFKYTGIWPINRHIFTEDDFLCSYVTDRNLAETEDGAVQEEPEDDENVSENSHSQTGRQIEQRVESLYVQQPRKMLAALQIQKTPEKHNEKENPSTSCDFKVKENERSMERHGDSEKVTTSNKNINKIITPEQVRPYPKAKARKIVLRKRKGKSKILTDTPIKLQIVEELTLREKKKQKKPEASKLKKVTKKILVESSESSSDESIDYADSSSGNEFIDSDNTDNEIDSDDILLSQGDFVVIKEGVSKGTIFFSVGEILSVAENDTDVQYYKHVPSFKFVRTEEHYVFNKKQVYRKLPLPEPTALDERNSCFLKFPCDLSFFMKSMKCLK